MAAHILIKASAVYSSQKTYNVNNTHQLKIGMLLQGILKGKVSLYH
jgi:hypothetical protein